MTQTDEPILTLDHLDDAGRALLFTEARTSNSFTNEPVLDEELRSIWDLAKFPPTAANTQPLRVVFVRTDKGRARLMPHVNEGNYAKTLTAPVTAILAADTDFHEHTERTFPARPQMREIFADNPNRAQMARFNAAIQTGYLLLSVRAHGLAVGPMAGFDTAGVDAEFFPDGRFVSFLLVNIGHPGPNPWFPRLPRLDEEHVLTWA